MALKVVNEQAESPRVCVAHFTFGTYRAVDRAEFGQHWLAWAHTRPASSSSSSMMTSGRVRHI